MGSFKSDKEKSQLQFLKNVTEQSEMSNEINELHQNKDTRCYIVRLFITIINKQKLGLNITLKNNYTQDKKNGSRENYVIYNSKNFLMQDIVLHISNKLLGNIIAIYLEFILAQCSSDFTIIKILNQRYYCQNIWKT